MPAKLLSTDQMLKGARPQKATRLKLPKQFRAGEGEQKRRPSIFNKRTGGKPSEFEKTLIKDYVEDIGGDAVGPKQVSALAVVLRRKPEQIRQMIDDARETFTENTKRYVEIHRSAVEKALANGDYDVARRGAEWAMTNVSGAGARVIEKETVAPVMPHIALAVGVKIGGIDVDGVQASGNVTVKDVTDETE